MVRSFLFHFLVPARGPTISQITSTSDTFKVTWTKLNDSDSNGVIINYEVCYQLGSVVSKDCPQSINVSDVDNAELTGLKPAKMYTVAVRAYTAVGPGPLGASRSEITKDSGELKSYGYIDIQCVLLCFLGKHFHISYPQNARFDFLRKTILLVCEECDCMFLASRVSIISYKFETLSGKNCL